MKKFLITLVIISFLFRLTLFTTNSNLIIAGKDDSIDMHNYEAIYEEA